MLEPIVELIFEFLLQVVGEALIELGFHSIAEPFRKPPNPWLAALGYLLLGAVTGGLSLLLFTALFVGPSLRIANLIITPILVGLSMTALGAWRTRRGQALLRIDRFAYGYLFALSFAGIRFWLAR